MLYKVDAATPRITYSYYASESAATRTETDTQISLECLPCLQNCNYKCAPGYFLEPASNRCFMRCPSG